MPGRNDPCPCGSGKKYKKCHLAIDEARPQTPPTFHALDAELTERVLRHAADRLGEEFEEERDGLAEELEHDPLFAPLLPALLAHHVPIGGLTPVRVFAADRVATLAPLERRWLDASMAGHLSVLRVDRLEPGSSIEMTDVLTGRRHAVREVAGSSQLKAGDAVLGRLVPWEGGWVIAGSHAVVLPARQLEEVRRQAVDWLGDGETVPLEELRGEDAALLLLDVWRESAPRPRVARPPARGREIPPEPGVTYVFAVGPVVTDRETGHLICAWRDGQLRMLDDPADLPPGAIAAGGVEPALAARLKEGAVPDVVRAARVSLAYFTAVRPGMAARVTPQQVDELHRAGLELLQGAPWLELDDGLTVRLDVNGEHRFDAAIMGNAGMEFGLALYLPGEHRRMVDLMNRGQREQAASLDLLALGLDEEPPFAVEAATDAGLPARQPIPYRLSNRRPVKLRPEDAVLLAGAARVCAVLSPLRSWARTVLADGREMTARITGRVG